MDFTVEKYKQLLGALQGCGYDFQTFEQYLLNPKMKVILLRHDVDLLPSNSLRFAQIQNEMGIKGSYYFRKVPESWDEEIMLKIAGMGHELGYHYETMDTSSYILKLNRKPFNYQDLIDAAYEEFKANLEKMRKLVPVKTVCMHGSPRSPYDNREIWKKYDYKELGIIGEPYFDLNFNEVFYLTDTGRRWDGHKVSVRDKVQTTFHQSYHSTSHIIEGISNQELPEKVMFNFHPQRWHEGGLLWTKELFAQNVKNIVKKLLYVK